MATWQCPSSVTYTAASASDRCFSYAQRELVRLLGRLGITATPDKGAPGDGWWLRLGAPGAAAPDLAGLGGDGYVVRVDEGGAWLAAPSAKGVLNAVYELAERLGIVFLMPGDAGEWLPASPAALPAGELRRTPRFAHRGVFGGQTTWPHTPEEWLRFQAKLRFNAVSGEPDHAALCAELGLRLEVGGHGMAELLPRDLFATQPELFRLFQPEDFAGKRLTDSNFCPTHPTTRRIVTENFARKLTTTNGVYAIHAWADDLPAGGWCMCSRCRALNASDQAILAMRMQAEAVAASGKAMRVPLIAYHDTMYPGQTVTAPPECFLLFAPRERCYGHALDDPRCARNRWYFGALQAWQQFMGPIDDAHTFEYYFDQILFRGLYPFLPGVILRDMATYARHGIQTHLSLQVGGPLIAPEYNYLVFAAGQWDAELTPAAFIRDLATRLAPQQSGPWRTYLSRRQRVFAQAMQLCGHPTDVYLDYRFLPESRTPFAARMVGAYETSAAELTAAADALAKAIRPAWSPALRQLAEREANRARFEGADLRVMARQQAAINALAEYHGTGNAAVLPTAVAELRACLDRLADARTAATAAGLPAEAYYFGFNQRWCGQEIQAKLDLYAPLLAKASS